MKVNCATCGKELEPWDEPKEDDKWYCGVKCLPKGAYYARRTYVAAYEPVREDQKFFSDESDLSDE